MLSLRLEDSDQGGEQLVLRLGDWGHVCDEYYLALDRGIDPGDRSEHKVLRVLARLLEQWRDVLYRGQDGSDVFLPFDFSDQSTAWLRARLKSGLVTMLPGWSAVEGWSFFPSDITAHVHNLSDFQPLEDVEPLTAPKEAWLREIDASLVAARQHSSSLQPVTDPTPIFENFRGSYGTELLTAAVAHFDLFSRLAESSLSVEDLGRELGLQRRPMQVLATALQAMGLIEQDQQHRLRLTILAQEHLSPGGPFDVGDYVGLAATSPGVLEMVDRLKSNRPRGADSSGDGTAFIYRAGTSSAMDQAAAARHFTLALSGRAKNVAPYLAEAVPLGTARHLLDVAGGTGLYALACLNANPDLRAVVFDRPEVLKIASEFRDAFGMQSRLHLQPGDMFHDPLPRADVILLSNVLHDWDVPECQQLVARCVDALPAGGRLLIHDVFLNDDLSGPLPLALYSAALFTLTEGRAYSVAEYRGWLEAAGLSVTGPTSTLIHCGVLIGTKS
ncbi:MAG: methyltransferase [Planctomycetaceae bacterium]